MTSTRTENGAVSRRRFLQRSAATVAAGFAAPAIARNRPEIRDGIQSGDVAGDSAVVWSRCDRPARLIVEWDISDSFRNARRLAGALAAPGNGFAATARLTGLPPGQTIFWRAAFEDADRPGLMSAPETGHLRTHAAAGGPVRFVFGGDQVGAGWGIDPGRGGMRIYETMLKAEPDFLIHLGDRIYSDAPLKKVETWPEGRIWRNIVTPAKSRIAETVEDYRGCYSYNFLDDHYRRFAAAVPQLCTWDDHEVTNNWWPGRKRKERYRTDTATLVDRGRQAFFDYTPMRRNPANPTALHRAVRYGPLVEVFMLDTHSHRAPNRRPDSARDAEPMLGPAQAGWFKDALAKSTALWKVIASSVPIEVRTPASWRQDKWADGNAGAPRGREAELADILAFIKGRRIRDTVWVAADVHYGAAVQFHPDRAAATGFDPFWEFIAGPFMTSTRRPHRMDPTFGPERVFATTANGVPETITPYDELFWFGQGDIDPATGALTMTIRDVSGKAIYTQYLEPRT
ncbi:MAG: twin-arginine translocation signal domain-containing protein [Alphaproteobacteria bacterium]|nr:twin-arginine translocation signal domain-containing protein [Alphaproteobacteria bacterium]